MVGRYGREQGLTSFDIFTPYNRLFSSISPWGRNEHGRLVYRGWLRALPTIPEWNGLAPLLVVMIATVSFDGLSNTAGYEALLGEWGASMGGKTVVLVASCLLIGAAYYLACWAAAKMAGEIAASTVATRFAHTLVPIAFAYSFAHYFTLVIFEGQSVLSAIADPFGLGWNLFGTRDYKIDFLPRGGSGLVPPASHHRGRSCRRGGSGPRPRPATTSKASGRCGPSTPCWF